MSYYKIIDGVRYDKALLEQAEKLTKGKGDGRISMQDAQLIFKSAFDSGILTAVEYNTIRYVLDNLNVTKQATEWLNSKLDQETPYQRIIKSILQEALLLKGINWEIPDAEIQKQLDGYTNRNPFSLVLREAATAFLYSDETRTGLRRMASVQFGIPIAEREELTEKTRSIMRQSSIYLFPTNYLELIEAGELDFTRPYFYEPSKENWTFAIKSDQIPGYYFLSFVSRKYWYEVYNIGIETSR